MKACIYSLYNKRTKRVFYVGSTTKDPAIRFSAHVFNLKLNKSVFAMQIDQYVEVESNSDLLKFEKFWIRKYMADGCKLLNTNLTKDKQKYTNSVKLTNNEVFKDAKIICVDKRISIGLYVTEAIRARNKKEKTKNTKEI